MKTKGFTLIELLVTIAIIAILVTISFPITQNFIYKAQITKVQNEHMRGLKNAVHLYKADHGPNTWPAPKKTSPYNHEYFSWYGPPADEQESKNICKILRPYYGEQIKEDGTFKDLWGNQYAMKWDIDGSGKVEYYGKGFEENVPETFIVISLGKDKKQNNPLEESFDDIYSFCSYKDKALFK
jgi:prepilin-type N-terminal cleavage/methylation domain-containing protein